MTMSYVILPGQFWLVGWARFNVPLDTV